ncbi:potassium transporter 25-like isoform X2 [Camellia sinensis]|uniref:potassium transporter 25-like isoform X2 n=1 Tax=Camellia sinensis TaxID=4442 RepID=UPI0010363315|nr:potassium transporter 25-like isoform X2 [Camellia sinensis]
MDFQLSPSSVSPQLKETWQHTILLSFQSLGVVFGRLSIAPLFVFATIGTENIESVDRIHELFSFVFWTLTIIPLLKYALIVLRADYAGEGGIFALYSLLCRHAKVGLLPNDKNTNDIMCFEEQTPSNIEVESRARRAIEKHKSSHYLMLVVALFGSCMTVGDGILTPALSVLSASSGLGRSLADISYQYSSSERTRNTLEKDFKKYVPVPAACVILICLFTLQHYGSHKIGFMFAPVVIIWLLFISGVGLYNICHYDPQIIYAISPTYMYRFMRRISPGSWGLLGSILLCAAGSEAMFADLGHFSRRSITVTFVCLIYPALVLCYAGQAAFISKNLGVSKDVFHLSESVPNRSIRHIFRVLSLFASAVGSQATITASFSIINQCLALGCFPRVKVIHTSDKIHGQVYIPDVNCILMLFSIAITIGFRNISLIGNATGLAIIFAMLVTTCFMSLVIALYWEKSLFLSVCFLVLFGSIEIIYLSACLLNFPKGAWYLVVHLVIFMTIMLAWHYGTLKKYQFDFENKLSLDWLTELGPGLGVTRVPGIGFIYTDIVTGIPAFFSHFITNLPAFHQVLIFVTFKSLPVPYIPACQRYLIGRVGPKEYKVYRCIVRYGYCDHVRDTDDFEKHIICSIGEFISREENDFEASTSPEGKMIVVGSQMADRNALIPLDGTVTNMGSSASLAFFVSCFRTSPLYDHPSGSVSIPIRRKKVRFVLPPNSPQMRHSVREELQELVDARESGTAYFLGQSHLTVRRGSNFLKKFLIMTYVFLDKNCREPPVALNIPHAALVEVGMVYII